MAINAIHLDCIPRFDYDSLLWDEREIRSVINMTRADARDFLDLAAQIEINPTVDEFPLERINDALRAVNDGTADASAAIAMI